MISYSIYIRVATVLSCPVHFLVKSTIWKLVYEIWNFYSILDCENIFFSCALFFLLFIIKQVLPEGKCGHRNVLSKRQVWMSIFHIINFKKKKFMDTGVLDIFNKKTNPGLYFCLASGPVFLFQIFIIAPSPFQEI